MPSAQLKVIESNPSTQTTAASAVPDQPSAKAPMRAPLKKARTKKSDTAKARTKSPKKSMETALPVAIAEVQTKTSQKPTKARSAAAKREATATDVMQSPALHCHPEASLNDAVRLMWEHDVGAIVIVDEDCSPIGMLTDRDACMAAYTQGVALFHGQVASAMSKSIVSCQLDTPIGELREKMAEAQIRRIPVVDEDGKLSGLIGISDLMKEAQGSLPKNRKRGSSGPMMLQLVDAVLQDSID